MLTTRPFVLGQTGKAPWLTMIAAVLLVLLLASNGTAATSVNVPLDNWAYGALDKLVGFGLIKSDIQGTRPFSRQEVARLVGEALENRKARASVAMPLADHFLERFQREYAIELNIAEGTAQQTYIKPLQEVQARYVYVNGEPRRFLGFPKSNSGTDATEGTPMVYNNEGVIYTKNNNFSLQFSSTAGYGDFSAAYFEPLLLIRENKGLSDGSNDVDVRILKGYAKLSQCNVELQVGRDSMWWGQARHGDLLLTNNAEPLDMVKLSNPEPVLLPWIFYYLGPFKYTIFVARLEDDRVVPHPGLSGMKFNFKPTPWFEMGVATTFMFGGEGRPSFSLGDFIDVIGFQGGNSNANVNQLAALDFRFRFPSWLWNAELYGEYGGEDSGGLDNPPEEVIFDDDGYVVGLYLPRIGPDGRADFRIEYTNNAHRVDSTPGFWYGHNIYKSGYTYERQFLGHHMGGDASDLFLRSTYYIRNDLVVGADYDWMLRGITLGDNVEKVHEFGADVTYDLNSMISVMGRIGYRTVDNFNMVAGDDQSATILMTGIKLTF